MGMSRKVRWESAQWSPGHKPCFILPPKGRRAPQQTGCLLLQRSPSASSRAGLGLRKQRTDTLSGRPLWVNISSPLAPSSSESHGGCGGRSIGWIQTWSEKALGHRGAWQAPVCVQAMLGAGQTHLWVRWSRRPALHSCPSFQVLSGLDLRQQPWPICLGVKGPLCFRVLPCGHPSNSLPPPGAGTQLCESRNHIFLSCSSLDLWRGAPGLAQSGCLKVVLE